MSAERLQKVLAAAGVASRRDCEELIRKGRVAVNGRVMRELGARVDPEVDAITVDGQPVTQAGARTYLLLHKPVGYVSTADDPQGRATVVDLIRGQTEARVFPVGRLDLDSEGLLLLTDDGDLAYRLTHPSFEVEKEYRVLLNQAPSPEALRNWRDGVDLEGQLTVPAWVEVLERADEGVWVRVVLREGRKRQVREVASLLGYEVLRLIRVREGTLTLNDLAPGTSRPLSEAEVEALRKHVAAESRGAARRGSEAGLRSEREPAKSGPKRISRPASPVRSHQYPEDGDADAFAEDNRGNDRRADRQPQGSNSYDQRGRPGSGYSRERTGGGGDQRGRPGSGYSRERTGGSGYSRERTGSGGDQRGRPGSGYSRERTGSGGDQRGRPGSGYSRERSPVSRSWSSDGRRRNDERRPGTPGDLGRRQGDGFGGNQRRSGPREYNQSGRGSGQSSLRQENYSGRRSPDDSRYGNRRDDQDRGQASGQRAARPDSNSGSRRDGAGNGQAGDRRPPRADSRPGGERGPSRPRRTDTPPRSTPRPRPEADEDDE